MASKGKTVLRARQEGETKEEEAGKLAKETPAEVPRLPMHRSWKCRPRT